MGLFRKDIKDLNKKWREIAQLVGAAEVDFPLDEDNEDIIRAIDDMLAQVISNIKRIKKVYKSHISVLLSDLNAEFSMFDFVNDYTKLMEALRTWSEIMKRRINSFGYLGRLVQGGLTQLNSEISQLSSVLTGSMHKLHESTITGEQTDKDLDNKKKARDARLAGTIAVPASSDADSKPVNAAGKKGGTGENS